MSLHGRRTAPRYYLPAAFSRMSPPNVYSKAGRHRSAGISPASTVFGDIAPNWSPTGDKITFVINGTDEISISKIYIANADGTNRQFFDGSEDTIRIARQTKWSPDGSKIIFHMSDDFAQ